MATRVHDVIWEGQGQGIELEAPSCGGLVAFNLRKVSVYLELFARERIRLCETGDVHALPPSPLRTKIATEERSTAE